MRRIAILGPGGVGGFLAAALRHAGREVIVVAREETARAIAEHGIHVRSRLLGELHERPTATTELTDQVDVLVIAVKATGLEQALERIATQPPLVVPLLNGLDHLKTLRERFGQEAVVAATIRVEATRTGPTEVEQTSPFLKVELTRGEEFAQDLNEAGVPAEVTGPEAQVMWSKLVRLNALALSTAAYDASLGEIRDDPERRAALLAAVDETAAVAAADGAHVDPAAIRAELLEQAHPELRASLARDVAAKRPTELDAIAGSVLRAAQRHGLSAPTIERLAERVRQRLP